MPSFEQFARELENNPVQKANELRARKLVLEQEVADLEQDDPGNPEIAMKNEQIAELDGLIARLEAEDMTGHAEEEKTGDKGRKAA